MTTETCENCGKAIGKLEARFLFREQVVCKQCDAVLNAFDEKKFAIWQKHNTINQQQKAERDAPWNVVGITVGAVIVFVALVILCVGAIGMMSNKSFRGYLASKAEGVRDVDARNVDLSIQAYRLANKYVEQRLKCPSTAKFSLDDSARLGNQVYLMRSHVDSENSFGAMIRTHFIIKIQFIRSSDNTKWNWKVLLFETT